MMGGKRIIIQVMEEPEEGKDQKMPPALPRPQGTCPLGKQN